MSRVIKSWAGIYDLVSLFVYLIFKGTKRLYQDIISMSGVKNGDRVIDVGCGTGEFLLELLKNYEGIEAHGIDASQEMVAIAQKKAGKKGYRGLSFEFAQAESLPYESEAFDCAFNIFLLHHLPMESKLKCLKGIHRVLKPKASLLLVDVDKPTSLLGRAIGLTRHGVREIRENMEQSLTELLIKSGFSAIEMLRQDYGIFSFIRCKK